MDLRRQAFGCLGIEADRMANMVLNDHQLETEREVVKNERLMRTENDPEGAMYEALYENAYSRHSYQWPVIGRKPAGTQGKIRSSRLGCQMGALTRDPRVLSSIW